MRIYCFVLLIVVTLVSTCLAATERGVRKSIKAEEVLKSRNEVEEHWNSEFKRYRPSESNAGPREFSRIKSEEKKMPPTGDMRKSSKSRRSYQSQ